jgi:hypothetical protein
MATVDYLRETTLSQLIRKNCCDRRAVRITVQSGTRIGEVGIADGQVEFAVAGQLEGDLAVEEMLAWYPGVVRVFANQSPWSRNVAMSWSVLLEEGRAWPSGTPNNSNFGELRGKGTPPTWREDDLLATKYRQTLSELELWLANIFKSTPDKHSLRTFVFMANAVNRILDLIAEHPLGAGFSAELVPNLLDATGSQIELRSLVSLDKLRVDTKKISKMYIRWVKRVASPHRSVAEACEQLYWMLFVLCAFVVELLASSTNDRQNRTAGTDFLHRVTDGLAELLGPDLYAMTVTKGEDLEGC